MADQQSIERLAFNFESRTFAYRRLAQGLNRSLSAFSSFLREYLDPVIRADQCAQYVDDIGIAANTPEQLIKTLQAVFQCLLKAGLKLSMAKCHSGVQEVDFLARTITTNGVALKNKRLPKSSKKSNFHDPKKHFNDILAFWIITEITYPDWQNDSHRSSNYSEQLTPKPKFRLPLISWKSSGK